MQFEKTPSPRARLSFLTRSWTIQKEGSPDLTVNQIALPLFACKPVTRDLDFSFLLTGVSLSSDGEGKSDYSGLTDTRFGATYRFRDGRYFLSAALNLPTGKAPLDGEEENLSIFVADRILGFPVKRLGEGFDVSLAGGHALLFPNGTVVSAGAGYLLKGEYEYYSPNEEEQMYRPGDEVFLSAGVERALHVDSIVIDLRGDIRYRMFGADRRNGKDFYEEGDQVEFLAEAAFLFKKERRADLQVFAVFKGDGSEGGVFGAGDIDSLSLERYLLRSLDGDCLEVRAGYTHRLGDRVDLLAHGVFSSYGEYGQTAPEGEEYLLGSGHAMAAGAGFRYLFSENNTFLLRASGLTGKAEDGAVTMSGVDVTVILDWVF